MHGHVVVVSSNLGYDLWWTCTNTSLVLKALFQEDGLIQHVVKYSKCFYPEQVQKQSRVKFKKTKEKPERVLCNRPRLSEPMSTFLQTLTSPKPKRTHPGRPLQEAEEGNKSQTFCTFVTQ
ncbi:hypothetical protein PAMA_011188 [Pampus argenteus]